MKTSNDGPHSATGMFARPRMVFLHGALLSLMATAPMTGHASAVSRENDARAFFTQFVAAQNSHDAMTVASLLWDSPNTLWITRGIAVKGVTAIVATLTNYYAGTWRLKPDMGQFQSTELAEDVQQILVPVTFTRGLPGLPAQDNTFLICQTLVRTAGGWRVASIIPVANTQLK